LGSTVKAEGAATKGHGFGSSQHGGGRSVANASLFCVVDEVTTGSVRTESARVEGAAQVRLVLGVAGQIPQLMRTMRELTLVAVLADATFLVRTTQLRLVATRVDVGRRSADETLVHGLAVAPVQLAVSVLGLSAERVGVAH
jgi:hypothetical protein